MLLIQCRVVYIRTNIKSNVFTMGNKNKLSAAEIICLQMNGISTTDIINTDIDEFKYLLDVKSMYKPALSRAKLKLSRQAALGIKTITVHDEDFPPRLLAIDDDCPAVIFYMGDISLLKQNNMVAIIGARAADTDGLEIARYFGIKYSVKCVISGLARGIDTEAHWGCIDAEEKTIAVVGSGLDIIHPKDNITLQQKILDTGGLVVSEQPMGTKASPRTLIARTRLQVALADNVIVIECEKESGTMHAVNFALRYKKQIFAVDNDWSGNRYLLDNGLAHQLPTLPEHLTDEETIKQAIACVRKIYRETDSE